MSPLVLSHSGVVPVPPEQAYDTILSTPLEQVFDRRFLAIAPIVGSEQDGAWGTVGQQRTIRQSDGSAMHEELTVLDRPHAFGYALRAVKGPLRLLAGRVAGEWRFAPVAGGTEVTWTWTLEPAAFPLGLGLPTLGPLWRGYARLGFERLAGLFPAA